MCVDNTSLAGQGASGGAVDLGTTLKVGSLWVRFPVMSLESLIYIILPAHYGTGFDSASKRNQYEEYFVGVETVGV